MKKDTVETHTHQTTASAGPLFGISIFYIYSYEIKLSNTGMFSNNGG